MNELDGYVPVVVTMSKLRPLLDFLGGREFKQAACGLWRIHHDKPKTDF